MVLAALPTIVYLVIPALLGFVCYRAAEDKGRNGVVWGIVGFLIPIVGLLFVALLPRIKPSEETPS
jgi:predicted cobalt transporter CbtA